MCRQRRARLGRDKSAAGPTLTMHIELDDLSRSAVHELLQEHLANMYELSPPEQVFALDLSKLKSADITFWTAWEQGLLLGCGALKELSPHHGEIKSMRTPAKLRGLGAGRAILHRIAQPSLTTGSSGLSAVGSRTTPRSPACSPHHMPPQLLASACSHGRFHGAAQSPRKHRVRHVDAPVVAGPSSRGGPTID